MNTKYVSLICLSFLLTGCNKNKKQDQQIENTKFELITIQPFYTDLLDRCKDDDKIPFPEGIEHESDIIIEGAKRLANSLDNVSYEVENIFKDSVIDKELFKKLGPNQIISIQSHGDYMDPEYIHSTIVTGADYIEEEISKEDEERIVESTMFNDKTFHNYSAITAEYVKSYCPNINGSIVYMGQCHGGHDWALATAFLDKGAVAVYGASTAIQMHYGDMMQFRVTELLGQVNPETKNYYTTGEALKKAQTEYGIDDKVLYGGGANGARMLLYGDPYIRVANK